MGESVSAISNPQLRDGLVEALTKPNLAGPIHYRGWSANGAAQEAIESK